MIFLVRHAHAVWKEDDQRPLSSEGEVAAHRVADLLAPERVALVVSSPYRRAIQTVEPLAARLGVPIQIDEELRERHVAARGDAAFAAWMEASWRDFDIGVSGEESSRQAQDRISTAIDRLAAQHDGANLAVATHGNVLALFLHRIDPTVDHAFWRRLSLPDVFAIERQGESWSYRRVWDDGRK